jgi:hypothetical protein
MNQDVDNQIGGANFEASRVTPEEIAELLYQESDKKRTPLDLMIGGLFILISVLTATLLAWWVV